MRCERTRPRGHNRPLQHRSGSRLLIQHPFPSPTTPLGSDLGPLNVDPDDDGLPSQALLRFGNLFGSGAGQVPVGAQIFGAQLTITGVDAGIGRGGGQGVRYGLGVQMRPTAWGLCYGHAGWFPGYLSEVAYFPEHKVAIAVQFNTDVGRSIKKGLPAYVGDIADVILTKGQ